MSLLVWAASQFPCNDLPTLAAHTYLSLSSSWRIAENWVPAPRCVVPGACLVEVPNMKWPDMPTLDNPNTPVSRSGCGPAV